MKLFVPIMVILLLLCTSFVGVGNQVEELISPILNNPPYVPSNPSPPDGSCQTPLEFNLTWQGGDPDPEDYVSYEIYFGKEPDPPYIDLIGQFPSNYTYFKFEIGPLELCKTYYWKIVAKDNHGLLTEGPIWKFTTFCYPPEPPCIEGPIRGESGIKYDYYFSQYNQHSYNVSYFIDWGDNTTTGWTDFHSAGETITRNHTWVEKGDYIIRAKVRNIYGEETGWSYFEVRMPHSFNDPFWWFNILLDRFPLLQRLLERLIR